MEPLRGASFHGRDLAAIGRLWRELSEFPAAHAGEALAHGLDRLTSLIGGANASWMAGVLDPDSPPDHPLGGWEPADIVVLHDSEEYARGNQATLEHFASGDVDAQSRAMVASAGGTRAVARAAVLDGGAWSRSWLLHDILRPLGMGDRLVGAFPVTSNTESYFALDRAAGDRPFGDRSRNLLHLFLSGCPLFHEEQFRIRGLLDASRRLSPRERDVLEHLLTDCTESEMAGALGISPNTAHQYVTAVYRRFGVRSRAALVARWLRYSHPRSGDPT